MWENYQTCKDEAKRVKILESIINIQPYLSGYYEATKDILEDTVGTTATTTTNHEPIRNISNSDGDQQTVTIDSDAWTIDDNDNESNNDNKLTSTLGSAEPEPVPEPNINNYISEPEPEPEPSPEPEEKPQVPKEKDMVNLDIVGRWPCPFDIEPWLQCTQGCVKWFRNEAMLQKHISKYHS